MLLFLVVVDSSDEYYNDHCDGNCETVNTSLKCFHWLPLVLSSIFPDANSNAGNSGTYEYDDDFVSKLLPDHRAEVLGFGFDGVVGAVYFFSSLDVL